MSIVGKVDSLWRYPVKSMRGEELDEAFTIEPISTRHFACTAQRMILRACAGPMSVRLLP